MEKELEIKLNEILTNQNVIIEAVVKIQSKLKDNPPDDPTGKPKP